LTTKIATAVQLAPTPLIQGKTSRAFFYSLDGIRGVAALLVILRHITPFFHLIDFQESYLAVDVFFVLSGVVLTNSYETRLRRDLSARRFCVIHLVRLYPLDLGGSVIGCVLHRPLAGFIHALMTTRVRTILDSHAPWPGIAFLAVLILACWGLDYVYDQPVRRRLLRLDFASGRKS
jgi:peptidoglycan/LPS O-acetylase OafA/YrhL